MNIDRRYVARAARELLEEFDVKSLPVDPVKLAEQLGILVSPKPTNGGVSGMLIRHGNEFAICYATHIASDGFKRFCVAHELGHYRLPGHVEAVLTEDIHESHTEFASVDKYEREADLFAAELLMPNRLLKPILREERDGLSAIKTISINCRSSLTASAIRYAEVSDVPTVTVLSRNKMVDCAFMSKVMRDFRSLDWLRKGDSVPYESLTYSFEENRETAGYETRIETSLDEWFGGDHKVPGNEEVVGLGSYGRTLTVLSFEHFADDIDDEDGSEEFLERLKL